VVGTVLPGVHSKWPCTSLQVPVLSVTCKAEYDTKHTHI